MDADGLSPESHGLSGTPAFSRLRRVGSGMIALALAASGVLVGAAPSAAASDVEKADYGPGKHSLVVPAAACAAEVVLAGASGGTAIPGMSNAGGAGAVISFRAPVAPGDVLEAAVGGAGGATGAAGANGGGPGGPGEGHFGAGGGGASELSSPAGLLAIAGGGGGSGGGQGTSGAGGDAGVPAGPGAADGTAGQAGTDQTGIPGGGRGGGSREPGAGGVHSVSPAQNGSPGSGRSGGAGGLDKSLDTGGGGGGGASTVLNGVAGGGGGGGSSFVSPSVSFQTATAGSRAQGTDGYLTITWVRCDYDLALTKKVSAEVFESGNSVDYAVTVTNLGPQDMPAGAPVVVDDAKATGATLVSASSSSGSGVSCTPGTGTPIAAGKITCGLTDAGSSATRGLRVGESLVLTYRQVLTGTEPVENTATVTDAQHPDNNSGTATTRPAAPSLSLVKSADVTQVAKAGEKVEYRFVVTNTGNVVTDRVAVDEVSFSGSGSLGVPSCPSVRLAPGESTTCTATYTATQEDVDRGRIDNVAVARGVTPAGRPVASNDSAAQVTADQQPSLSLVKSADVTQIAKAGQEVQYRFLVTSTGNVTLRKASIGELAFSGSGRLAALTCPEDAFGPGESVTCTARYTSTSADMKTAALTNTAEASAGYGTEGVARSLPSAVRIAVVPPLAMTGSDTTGLIIGSAIAAGLVVVGGWLTIRTRRS